MPVSSRISRLAQASYSSPRHCPAEGWVLGSRFSVDLHCMRTLLHTRLRPMSVDDITQVADIERESFPSMWPQTAYRRELTNKIARYTVVTELRDERPAPPAGVWSALRRIV